MHLEATDERMALTPHTDTESEEDDQPFDEAPVPSVSQKDYTCPKTGCGMNYSKGRNVKRLEKHVKKKHMHDGNLPKYLQELKTRFPPRNQGKKNICNRCGKEIIGSHSNMVVHQSRSGCKPTE